MSRLFGAVSTESNNAEHFQNATSAASPGTQDLLALLRLQLQHCLEGLYVCLLTVEKGIKGFLHHPELSEGAGYCVTLSLASEQLHASEKMQF